MRLVSRLSPVFLVVLGVFTAPVRAQVSLTTLGTPYTQSFDTLATSGTANTWTDNVTPLVGWYSQFQLQAANPTTYRADAGTSNTGAIYSYGTGTNTERAFGSVASGTPGNIFNAVRLVNNTGSTITSLDVSFTGEQWRAGGCTPTPCTPAAQKLDFQYQVANAGVITDANTPTTGWLDHNPLDFTSPTPGTSTAAALDGNNAANRTALSATITVTVSPGQEVWLRWLDTNDPNNDHGLAIDEFSVTPQGSPNAPVVPSCPASLATVFGVAASTGVSASDSDGTVTSATITSITPSDPGTITLTGFTPAGGVGGTANATLNVSNTTPVGNYNVTIQWANNDVSPQTATCSVAVSVTPITKIHDVQGNGAATPIPGSTVTVEGVVVANFQGTSKLQGFFLEEEDADFDADPNTSEGIFIFCSSCPTPVAEGQRVRATGTVSEFNNMTEITASTAPSVVVTDAGNHLAEVTPAPIDLPVVGDINAFYETREGMLVTFVDTLTVSEYFELARFGHIELFEGGRPRQFTETSPPNAAGYAAHLDNLDRRRVILDDDNNRQNAFLPAFGGPPDGSQFVFYPRANGGFSVGTQGTDFFRGGDLVNGLTGVLHWSFPGTGADTWRIRPTAAAPATFTVANPRPATPPAVGGAIKAAGMNLLNYFTTIDTTANSSSGPCGPSMTQDCRGADSVAELNRQRERASIVVCGLNADVFAFMELENTTPSDTITDLLGAINARCGGAHPYDFVNTGGTLGTDAIRVQEIYRTGIVSSVGSPLVDLDPIHNRPPTAQTFDVVDPANPAFGERFTVIANHFKSKGCDAAATGADADLMDGQGCYNGRRTAQAARLLTWINGTVLPAAGDPDVLLLGDFNSYAQEDPVTTLEAGGFTDLESAILGPNAYSYLFDGQLGHLDYAFSSTSLTSQVTGVGAWHINADEVPLFDYNDEVFDSPGEANFEEKPDGSALVPPRVVFQPASPYRASDHDPVLVGLFQVADLSITKVESADPVTAGTDFSYTITVTNGGPDPADNVSWTDTLPTGTTFVSLSSPGGWSCTTPAVGAGGMVSCSINPLAVGSAVFTLTVHVDPGVTDGTVLSNTATETSTTGDSSSGNDSATETTTVAASAALSVTKEDNPDPVFAGGTITYTLTVTNAGPSDAASVSLSDTLPAGTTFVSLSSPGGWSCTTPAVGAGGTVSCSAASLGVGSAVFTLVVAVNPGTAAGTVLTNTATASSASSEGTESGTATTTVLAAADLSVTKVDTPDPVPQGGNVTYDITLTNSGPNDAEFVNLEDTLPAGTTFVSLTAEPGWTCTTPAVGAGGTVSCSNPLLAAGSAAGFSLTVAVDSGVTPGTVITNTATASAETGDPNPNNDSGSADTTVAAPPDTAEISVTKVDDPDPVTPGSNLVYTITVNNSGPSDATSVNLVDPLPPETTFVSLSSPGGWTCTTPAVGTNDSVLCSIPSLAPGSAVFTLTVAVGAGTAPGSQIFNTATVSSANDPDEGNNSGSATTTVPVPTMLSGTKTVTGTFTPGGAVTYTVVLTNNGTIPQADNPGNEFTDVLPATLTLVSASATSGTATATLATNTVTWNGSLAGGASVTITINATIDAGATPGTTISNQGTFSYDADGNGTNEASGVTDDPGTDGAADPTSFTVAQQQEAPEIPALDGIGLALLALLLAAAGAWRVRRRRA
jgi:hypothetical protein